MQAGRLKVAAQGEREIVIARSFDAPRALVYRAYTEPALLKRWLLGPDGWVLAVCQLDLEVGGAYRYVWRNAEGTEMGMGGVFREIVPGRKLVCTEKFDQAWYPGEGLVSTVLADDGDRTLLTTTVRYESQQARDLVLKSGMERGLQASYDRLEQVLAAA